MSKLPPRLSAMGAVARLIACLAVSHLAFAGAARSSEHSYPASVLKKSVMVPMRDGVSLATDIYFPSADGREASPGRFPVLLVRTPYDKARYVTARSSITAVGTPDASAMSSQGYVVVVQDVRGVFASEGVFEPMRNEGHDGYDTVAWLTKQPWSDGRIGTFGPSYMGGSQILLAAERPRGLVAGFSQVAATDQFRNEWVYLDGALALTAAYWTFYMAPELGARSSASEQASLQADFASMGIAAADAKAPTPPMLEKLMRTLPLRDMPVVRRMSWWPQWLDHWDQPRYFESNDTTQRLQNIAVPFLHLGGWYDLFLRNTYEHYKQISARAPDASVRASQRLLIGPWSHGTCESCESNSAIDPQALQMAWMDQWFKGKKHPFFEHRVVLYVMGVNRWRAETTWPLADTQRTRYYLHSQGAANTVRGNGTLSTSAPRSEPPDEYKYDPHDPAPTLGGIALSGKKTAQNAAETRSDVLIFSTPELTADVEVTGEVSATLFAASSAQDTDWWVKLVDVAPDGTAYILTQGLSRARYRGSRTEPRPLTPGKVEKYAINMWATSNVFKKGHRIRVEVTSSNFPLTDRNPNSFVDLSRATEKDFVVAFQKIYHDAERPSHLDLPIIPSPRARKWIDTPFPHAAKVSARY